MAGTVVWKRSMRVPYRWNRRISGVKASGDPHASSNPPLPVPTQTTTSFRTGSGSPNENDEVIPTGHAYDAFRAFYREYRDLNNPLDSGHPFLSVKQVLEVVNPRYHLQNASGSRVYDFPLCEDYRLHWGGSSTFPTVDVPDLNWYGTKAIRETIPTNSVADLSTALGELVREGLPAIFGMAFLKTKAFFLRETGSEYLNIEFGWKPFISEIQDLLKAVLRSAELIRQYERDSGRVVRRSYYFPEEFRVISATTKNGALANPDNSSNFLSLFNSFGLGGQLSEVVTETRKVWFKGAYSYYLSDGKSLLSKIERFEQKARYLLGIRLTPEVLWNLAPWSWLSDWYWNLGDVLHNIEALTTDSLVIRYGYLMCTTTTSRVCTLTGVRSDSGALPPVVNSYTTIRKERIAATPYGFGLNPADFTNRQKAILAALAANPSKGSSSRAS